ncbi:MAG: TetR/AcrR family transcriptional regulator [Desulfobacterales bacterium]|nr:TetR/AcrR family transcriptional regulator [Desulfobacterales bacterium]
MKQETKYRIIEAGARIIHRKGYHHTGIQEILSAAGVPKGSFYFYFKNKEDFGLQVIEHYDDSYAAMLEPVLGNNDLAPLEKIGHILDFFVGFFDGLDCECGCPVGNLSQEMGDLNPAFSSRLTESVEKTAGIYRDLLVQARDNGDLPDHISTREMGEFIVSSWHGALVKMKINRSTAPLLLHKKIIMAMLKG